MTTTISVKTYKKDKSHVEEITLEVEFGNPCLNVVTMFEKIEIVEEKYIVKNSKDCRPRTKKTERIVERQKETKNYELRRIKPEEIMSLRLSKVPGVIYKKDNEYFYSEIPGTLSINGKVSGERRHVCSNNCTMVCKGCPRTSCFTVDFQLRANNSFKNAVLKSWRIEKFDFIKEGLESFNMDSASDSFIVLECENYKKIEKPNSVTRPSAEMKLALATAFWDDFKGDRREMIERIRRNLIGQ